MAKKFLTIEDLERILAKHLLVPAIPAIPAIAPIAPIAPLAPLSNSQDHDLIVKISQQIVQIDEKIVELKADTTRLETKYTTKEEFQTFAITSLKDREQIRAKQEAHDKFIDTLQGKMWGVGIMASVAGSIISFLGYTFVK